MFADAKSIFFIDFKYYVNDLYIFLLSLKFLNCDEKFWFQGKYQFSFLIFQF